MRNKTEIKKAFSRYISESEIDRIVNDEISNGLTRFKSNIIVIQVHPALSDDDSLFREIFRILSKYDFAVDNIFFPFIYSWQHNYDAELDFKNMINELFDITGNKISVICGTASGLKGNIGAEGRMTYSFAADGMEAVISELLKMERGSAKAFTRADHERIFFKNSEK